MSGFVATAPVPPATDPQDAIENDGWFPSLSIAATRNAVRLDGTVTPERLRAALVNAMLNINRQLRGFKAERSAAGQASLEAASAGESIDGQPRLVLLYLRAVMCSAKADLMERYRDFDADGKRSREFDGEPSIDEERRNVQWAVRDILGQTHVVAELI